MKVSIFSTCVMDLMFPQVGIAMVEVLERLGIETDLPEGQINSYGKFINHRFTLNKWCSQVTF